MQTLKYISSGEKNKTKHFVVQQYQEKSIAQAAEHMYTSTYSQEGSILYIELNGQSSADSNIIQLGAG